MSSQPTLEGIAAQAAALAEAAGARRHRQTLVVAGDRGWCHWAAEVALEGAGVAEGLWVSDQAPGGVERVPAAQARRFLGQELPAVVFDAHAGFDADAFGAVAGAVRGGGLFLLLTPPLADWPRRPDPENARIAIHPVAAEEVGNRFLERLVRVIGEREGVALLEQGMPLPPLPPPPEMAGEEPEMVIPPFRTEDQQLAVEAIARVVTGHRRRPAVLISDRGRGKSAALGIAAARFMEEGLRHIVVTAPRLDAVRPVFEHAAELLPKAEHGRGLLQAGGTRLEFIPPDALVREPPEADLVLVDEAAGIPAPLLERMLRRHARIAFATTTHGYEGTGRGFAVRFRETLDRLTPDWREFRLRTPVRWAAGDPLEGFVFRALLLDADPAPEAAVVGATADTVAVERLDPAQLAGDETALAELFGLLVLAHYRTRPLDLRQLLDGPGVRVHALRWQGHVVATALAVEEGGLEPDLARAVYLGERRVRGHLIPQSLAHHAGLPEAPGQRGLRVMRVAVHPALRRQGLGLRLLQAVTEEARAEGYDWVGSSFGATIDLLAFWEAADWQVARVGVTREASSGSHSALVLAPLSEAGRRLHAAARRRLADQLPYQLAEPLSDLEPAIALRLLRGGREAAVGRVPEEDGRDLRSFAFGRRGYASCLAALSRLTTTALADPSVQDRLGPEDAAVLLLKVVQRRGWADTARALELSGRAEAETRLREAAGRLAWFYDLPEQAP